MANHGSRSSGSSFFTRSVKQRIAGAHVDVRIGIEIGTAAAMRHRKVVHELLGMREHQVLARPIGGVEPSGVRVIEEKRRGVDRVAGLGGLEAREQDAERDCGRRAVRAHLQEGHPARNCSMRERRTRALGAGIVAHCVEAHALGQNEENIAAHRRR